MSEYHSQSRIFRSILICPPIGCHLQVCFLVKFHPILQRHCYEPFTVVSPPHNRRQCICLACIPFRLFNGTVQVKTFSPLNLDVDSGKPYHICISICSGVLLAPSTVAAVAVQNLRYFQLSLFPLLFAVHHVHTSFHMLHA